MRSSMLLAGGLALLLLCVGLDARPAAAASRGPAPRWALVAGDMPEEEGPEAPAPAALAPGEPTSAELAPHDDAYTDTGADDDALTFGEPPLPAGPGALIDKLLGSVHDDHLYGLDVDEDADLS